MKKSFMLFAVVICVLLASMYATAKQGYQSATVVSVETHETPSNSNYAGSNPSDAPLQSEVYSYDIGIRLGCTVYRTRYDLAFDYLPSVFAPNHPIEVNLRKHVIEVSLPGDRTVRMSIDGRRSVKDESCMVRNSNATTRQFQKAVVVSVEKHEPEVALHRKFTDAPAPSSEYDANVSIRVNCVVYLGCYKSAIDYLPGVFVPDQSVQVSPEKHFLYVNVRAPVSQASHCPA